MIGNDYVCILGTMAKSMNKDNLEEILKLHGNIAKERNEKLINVCVERMMTILAKVKNDSILSCLIHSTFLFQYSIICQ